MDRTLRIRMLLEAGGKFSRPLRDLASGGRQADAALKGARDRLRDLERTKGNVDAFRRIKTDALGTERALGAASTKVQELSRAMAQAETPTRAMTRELQRAKQEAAALTRQHDAEQRHLQDLRGKLREAGVATGDLARHERELRTALVGANRELAEQERRTTRLTDRQRRMGAAREKFDRMQGVAGNLAGAGAGAIAGSVALGGGVWKGVQAAQTFESTMTDIAQKADLGRAQAAAMGKELLGSAKAANQLPEALQSGVDALAGFGLDPRQAVAMMRPIGRAATAYKAEIADLSAASFAAHDNLKVPIADTGRMIDAMAQAGKSGAFEIKDMAQYFPTFTAAYQALGQTGVRAGADLAAAAQITRKGAGDSATAATNLANVLQKLMSPATVKAFDKMGVDLPAALQRAYKKGKTPLEAIAELTNKTLKGNLGRIGYLFEDAQAQAGVRSLIQNMGEYRRIRADAIAAANANTVTDTDFAERLKDSAEQTKALSVNAQILAVNLGTLLLPTVNSVAQKIAFYAGWLNGVTERHPRLAKAAALTAAGLAVLLGVFGLLAFGAAAILGPIAVANAGLVALGISGGVASVGLLPIIGTVAAVVLGIAALAMVAYAIYQHWSAITGFFGRVWATIKTGALGAVGWFLSLPMQFATIGADLVTGLIRGITGKLAALRSTIVGAAGAAATWFRQKLGIHSPSRVFMGIGGYVMQGLDRGLQDGAAEPLARVRRVAGTLAGTFAAGAAIAAPALAMEARATIGAPALAMEARTSDARTALARGATMRGEMRSAQAASAAARSAPAPQAGHTFNIYPQPGQDATDIARTIERMLDERDRRQRADRRATFRDDPDGADV